jgi:hypothetical protein
MLDQVLKIALSVQEAEKQEKFSESFYANFDDLLRLRSPSLTRHTSYKPCRSADMKHTVNHMQNQRYKTPSSDSKPKTLGNRNAQTKAALRCYECKGVGHFARECPARLNREANSTNSPGRRNPSERSRHSRSPTDKVLHRTKKGVNRQATNQGNGN